MFRLLSVTILLAFYTSIAATGNVNGYHYEKPSLSLGLITGPANLRHGHSFGPIPTLQPLPPVPAIPALPTPRSSGQTVQTQTFYQTHPLTTGNPSSTYFASAGTGISKIAQQYQSPPRLVSSAPSAPSIRSTPTGYGFPLRSSAPSGLGSNLPNPAPAPVQPLRVPFGKQAIVSYPTAASSENTYQANGRQLKQYAVIEIIDNDIEQNTQPFLSSPFFDSFRAHVGASGTGATPEPLGGIQIGSRSSASLLAQQRSASQGASNDAVALGSGGLGFIRLANGNVYLGSGSLGYVSGQKHSQEINEARTRTGAPQPDAVHFGHGALGNPGFNRFVYRFK